MNLLKAPGNLIIVFLVVVKKENQYSILGVDVIGSIKLNPQSELKQIFKKTINADLKKT